MSVVRQATTAIVFLIVAGLLSPTLSAQDVVNNRKPTLEERLTFALRVRTNAEKKFVKDVVKLVDTGKLPQKIVDEAFFWVQRELERKKKGDPNAKKYIEKYPFFYFREILKLNAKKKANLIIK